MQTVGEKYDWREDPLTCKDCKYFNLIADFDANRGKKTSCKNIDYTKHWFYAPYFVPHCTGGNSLPCRHFKPVSYKIWLNQHFTNIDDYIAYQITHKWLDFHRAKVSLFLANERKTASYDIFYRDFYYGTYINEDGSLKCSEKSFYKKDQSSPIGVRLVREKQEYALIVKPEEETALDVLQNYYNNVSKRMFDS